MSVIMRIWAIAGGRGNCGGSHNRVALLKPERYLKAFNIEAHDGRGEADWTEDPTEAMQFDSSAEAMRVWNTQSEVRPLRQDGKPNKPLTAFTVELVRID
jgi:hypothetical protein